MKFVTLRLLAFGPFQDKTLNLDRGTLHLIYGPNEAGKSSALRAIRQTLYGMDRISQDAFRHTTNTLRLGALLERGDGRTLEFVRRKADKNALRHADDQSALSEDTLVEWFAGIDEEKFRMMFGIDHAQLRDGGAGIVRGQGKLAETLFAAAGGMVHLQKIQAELSKSYKALYTPGGRNQIIPKKRGEYDAARKSLAELQLPSETWRRRREELTEKEAARAALNQKLIATNQHHRRLERSLTAIPILARWKHARQEWSALPETPVLPAECRAEYEGHLRELEIQRRLADEARTAAKELAGQVALTTADDVILLADEVIERLRDDYGSHQKASRDRVGLVDHLDSLQTAIAQQSRGWNAAALSLSPQQKERIRQLGAEQQARSQQRTTRLAERQRWEQKLAELRARKDVLTESVNTTLLKALVDRVRQHGDLAAQIGELSANHTAAVTALMARVQRLRFWNGTLEELITFAAPTEETIDRFEDELQQLATDRQNERRRQTELADALSETSEQLQRLELHGAIPTQADLDAARAARENHWQQLDAALQAGQIPPGTDRVSYTVKVRQADEWADRLRAVADQVARKAELLLDQAKATTKHAECQQTLDNLEQQLAARQRAWQTAWTGLPQSPGTPAEMRRWLQERTALIDDWSDLQSQRAKIDKLEQQTARSTKELDAALGMTSASPTLTFALTQAEQRLSSSEQQRRDQEQHQAEVAHAERELAATMQQAETAEQAWQEWRQQWADAVKPLGLDVDSTAAEAAAIVQAWEAIARQQQEADQLSRRIASIDRDAAQFTADVAGLIERLCPAEKDRGVATQMAVLIARLDAAQAARSKQQALQAESKRQQQAFETAHRAQVNHEAAIDALCEVAGRIARTDLAGVIARWERRRELTATIQTLEEQLQPLANGVPLDEFASTVDALDADAVRGELDATARDQVAMEASLSVLDREIGKADAELKAMQGAGTAADQAESCQLVLTDLQEAAREYAVIRLAAAVLQRGIERYRDRHQGPLLSRASHLFSQLTCGSFSGLKSDLREKGEMIVGVRANGTDTVEVSEMSDGTCDQMYLALRLAGLEDWLDHHEPLPFIVDDVLLNFDDDRSTAALKVLAELSRRTQVLFFTHHDRLRELAASHLPADLLTVHHLSA